MKKIALQVLFSLPVYLVLAASIGGVHEWYLIISLGITASMISGIWIKSIDA